MITSKLRSGSPDDSTDAATKSHVFESDIAAALNEVVAEFSEVDVGSYPATQKLDYRTQITLESRDEHLVARAVKSLIGKVPADVLLRVE